MLKGLGKYQVTATTNGSMLLPNARINSKSITESTSMTRREVTASTTTSVGSSQSSTGSTGFGMTGSGVNSNYVRSVIEDFIPLTNTDAYRRIYRDIYYHQPIAGAAVDLLATLPWSDFVLTGLPTADMLRSYARSIDNIKVKTLLPELSIDYLVMGTFIGVLNFDANQKVFTSITPQDVEYCHVTPVTVYGEDPIIDVRVSPELLEALSRSKKDKRFDNFKEKLPGFILENAKKNGVIQLNPANTLYIPRRTFSTSTTGVSYYRRIVMLYLLEKALMRGTIESAHRRQRGILHIEVGDSFDWQPTREELTAITDTVIAADLDPTGAIIATRSGVQFNEIRSGSEFWRVDEISEYVNNSMLKALGISESLLSSESSISTIDANLSSFVESQRAFRSLIVRKTFANRLFPAIAVANGFKKTKKEVLKEVTGRYHEITASDGSTYFETTCNGEVSDYRGEDLSEYHIPRIHWHKHLKPEADRDYLDILSGLEEKGLPIPIRMLAAVGGVSLTEVMSSLDEDIRIRTTLDKYFTQRPKSPKEKAEAAASGGGGLGALASVIDPDSVKKNRSFETIAMRDPDTGKLLSRKGQKVINERANKKIAEALTNIAQRENRRIKADDTLRLVAHDVYGIAES